MVQGELLKDISRVMDSKTRRFLLIMGFAYLVFVIYGSLVPLDFNYHSLSEAWLAFQNISYLKLGIASRADWVANILVFVPLAFIWTGILWRSSQVSSGILASLLVFIACVGLSVTIEFVQFFFPPRTVSLNDIIAEGIGAGSGILLWWLAGPEFVALFQRWSSLKDQRSLSGRILFLYMIALFIYNLLPLDLTLSPVEIYHKWKQGRVNLLPFSYAFELPAQALYGLLTDLLIWVPVGFLWRLCSLRPMRTIWLFVMIAAGVLEFLQLFVFTRVTDITDIIMAGLGGGAGILLVRFVGFENLWLSGRLKNQSVRGGGWLWAILVWLAVLPVIFWYPYDFHFESEFIRLRLDAIEVLPFRNYYFGTEYRAATEVLHKVLFFIPLGGLLAWWVVCLKDEVWRRLSGIGVCLFVVLVAVVIELGQVLLPTKFPSLTDGLLESLGGGLGYFLVIKLAGRLKENVGQ